MISLDGETVFKSCPKPQKFIRGSEYFHKFVTFNLKQQRLSLCEIYFQGRWEGLSTVEIENTKSPECTCALVCKSSRLCRLLTPSIILIKRMKYMCTRSQLHIALHPLYIQTFSTINHSTCLISISQNSMSLSRLSTF